MKKTILFLAFSIALLTSTCINAQWQQTAITPAGEINCIATNGTNVFAGISKTGSYGFIQYSSDNGVTSTTKKDQFQVSLYVNGGIIYKAGGGDNLSKSTDNGATWTPYTALNGSVISSYLLSILVNGSTIFAGTFGDGIARSTDNGVTWTLTNTGLTNLSVRALAVTGSTIIAGTPQGIFISSDNGTTWTLKKASVDTRVLTVSGSSIFAGTYGFGVLFSNDNGLNWTVVNTGLPNNFVTALYASGNQIFAGPVNAGAYYSSDNGASWINISSGLPTPSGIGTFAVNSTTVFAGIVNSADTNGVWSRPLTSLLGVEENSTNQQLKIYPNPADKNIFIHSNEKVTSVTCLNHLGQPVKAELENNSINLSSLSQGLYLLNITSENGQKCAKTFIKK
jgi:hypothetical protein